MPALLKIVLAPFVLILAWDLFVIIDASQPRPWLWIVRRPHYEVTFSIEMPDGVHTATGVVEAVYFAQPWWDQTIPEAPSFGPGPIDGRQLNGEAVTMCLPGGKAISMALVRQFAGIPRRLDYASTPSIWNNLIFYLADKLLTQSHPEAFAKVKYLGNEWVNDISAFSASSIFGSYRIPGDLVPSMVFFENGADVHSAHLFTPENPKQWLGTGAKFVEATLSLTDAPTHSDSERCLPWLKEWEVRRGERDDRSHPLPRPNANDPIVHEANGRGGIETFWYDYFLYRSRYDHA